MSFVSTPTMRAYAAAVRARVPVLLWGSPGIGKTAKITSFGEKWGMHVEVVVGSTREPSDVLGLPMEDNGRVIYSPPAWAVNCNEAVSKGYKGSILFGDELSTASPAMQAAMLRLFQERVAGDLPLEDHVAIVAAANPPEDAANGYELAPPVANRFFHLNWHFDVEEWLDGVITDFDHQYVYSLDAMLGEGDDNARARTRGLVTAFLRAKPEMLNPGVPKDDTKAGLAWASPRSWTNVMAVLAELDPTDDAAALLVVKGLVGEGPAIEFLAWVSTADLHDPLEVIKNPAMVKWNKERPDRLFALTTGIAALVLSREDSAFWTKGVRALTACAEGNRADVALPAVRTLLSKMPRDAKIPAGTREAFADLFERTGRWTAASEDNAA
jgi:hypothetical protein